MWLVDVGGDDLDCGDVGDRGQGKGKDVVGNKGIQRYQTNTENNLIH